MQLPLKHAKITPGKAVKLDIQFLAEEYLNLLISKGTGPKVSLPGSKHLGISFWRRGNKRVFIRSRYS
jgi:hypothetical protein